MNDVCPGCGGPADNGHDRCVPPNVYLCTECENKPISPGEVAFIVENQGYKEYLAERQLARQKEGQERKARRAELVKEFALAHIASGRPNYWCFDMCFRSAESDADAFLKWEAEQ